MHHWTTKSCFQHVAVEHWSAYCDHSEILPSNVAWQLTLNELKLNLVNVVVVFTEWTWPINQRHHCEWGTYNEYWCFDYKLQFNEFMKSFKFCLLTLSICMWSSWCTSLYTLPSVLSVLAVTSVKKWAMPSFIQGALFH